jgi:hypothetical protein
MILLTTNHPYLRVGRHSGGRYVFVGLVGGVCGGRGGLCGTTGMYGVDAMVFW